MLYEFRSVSQNCLAEMEARLRTTLSHWEGLGGRFEVELLGVRPGNGPLDEAALGRFTAHTAGVIRAVTGQEPQFAASSTDSNIPLSLGIPANTIGTVAGGLAHTRQEWVDLASLPTGLTLALSLMLEYAANP